MFGVVFGDLSKFFWDVCKIILGVVIVKQVFHEEMGVGIFWAWAVLGVCFVSGILFGVLANKWKGGI